LVGETALRLLLVEDSPTDARLIREQLRLPHRHSFAIRHADRLASALAALTEEPFDAVLLDLGLPDSQGLSTLTQVLGAAPEVAVVVATGLSEEMAVEAVRAGAQDHIAKGHWTGELLARTLRYAVERKRTEARLRSAQKMEAVGQLAGGIAHDFNNLLNLVLGHAELLATELGPDHPSSPRLEQIQRAATRAAELTRQLLAFSRKQILQPTIVDLNQQLLHSEPMLRPLIGESIELSMLLSPGLGRVKVDLGQLDLVVVNLAVNARDAMPEGGTLTFETSEIELDSTYTLSQPGLQPGSYVLLTVSDTGTGMTPETLSRIFEPFFTTKPSGQGTGLGLATVYGILQQTGGHITAHSELGFGTTFKVFLPRMAAEVPSPVEVIESPIQGGSETILLVEDSAPLRALISEILATAGYTVIEACDAEDALLKVARQSQAPDCLLTDVVLPRLSGPELAERLRTERPDLAIIFMSGYRDEALSRHGLLATRANFLPKPFGKAVVLRKLREVLNRKEGIRLQPAEAVEIPQAGSGPVQR
jgi:two-component system, cell cycle sensor histidine kinase and response regulator CckA